MEQITISLPENVISAIKIYGQGLFEEFDTPDVVLHTATLFMALGMQKHVTVMTNAVVQSGENVEQYYSGMLQTLGIFAAQTLDELPVYLDVNC